MKLHSPHLHVCCGCVTDLKAAAAIIAVLGIVTSPSVAWALIRHAYVIRVSCFVSKSELRQDVVDINLSNVVSFGFGANAGLGPSCFGPKQPQQNTTNDNPPTKFVIVIKSLGWVIFLIDFAFVLCSMYFLFKLYHGSDRWASKIFFWVAALSTILSFLYGMTFVAACLTIGGAFPIYEFLFCIIDLAVWIYFLIVILSYRQTYATNSQQPSPPKIGI